MEKVCNLIVSEKNPKRLNKLMKHHRLYDIWKENLTMKPHNNKREGLKTSQSNTDNTMNQTLNLITKNKFLKEFGITRHTFTKWVKDRNLPITKGGYRTYIQKDKLEEWLNTSHINEPQKEGEQEVEWKSIF